MTRHVKTPGANDLRQLARQFEQKGHGVTEFTCREVGRVLGFSMRRRYEEAFELGWNEGYLWEMKNVRDMRVLMLCFAAAMVETGDL